MEALTDRLCKGSSNECFNLRKKDSKTPQAPHY